MNPDPQNPDDPMYQFINQQPENGPPVSPTSSQSNFTVRQLTPESISAGKPVLVTSTAHGLVNGMGVRATKFVKYPLANATGMEQLNNKLYYTGQVTADTFSLFNSKGEAIDGSNFTPYVSGGQFTVTGPWPDVFVVNPSPFPPSGVPAFPPD